jgi:hypothetical protein
MSAQLKPGHPKVENAIFMVISSPPIIIPDVPDLQEGQT